MRNKHVMHCINFLVTRVLQYHWFTMVLWEVDTQLLSDFYVLAHQRLTL